jgi:hypothetical protein
MCWLVVVVVKEVVKEVEVKKGAKFIKFIQFSGFS